LQFVLQFVQRFILQFVLVQLLILQFLWRGRRLGKPVPTYLQIILLLSAGGFFCHLY